MPYRTMTPAQAAEFLHVDLAELDHLIKKHDLPHENQGGRPVFRRQELHDWASRRILGASGRELNEYHAQATAMRPPPDRREAFLSQFLAAEGIEVCLEAGTRPSLLRELVKLAARTSLVTDDKMLLELLTQREDLCTTGIGNGVAIPHTRVHPDYLFIDTFLVVAYVPGGVPFGAPDGNLSDLFFMPCTQDDRTHLYMLTRLARLLQVTKLAEALRDCSTADDVISAFHVIETEFVQQHVKQ